MTDGYLIFDSAAGLTNSRASTNVLKAANYTNLGKGRPKFVEVWSDGGFTSGAEVISIRLKAGSTSPGANQLMEIGPISAATLSVAGMVAKFALPPEVLGTYDYFSLYYYAQTAVTTGGKVTAHITLDL